MRFPASPCTCLAFALIAAAMSFAGQGEELDMPVPCPRAGPDPFNKCVQIIYFNPADLDCLPDYQNRIDRIMTEIQNWYRSEMNRHGYGPMTFPLQRDDDGRLVIHVIKGNRTYAVGEEISGEEVRDRQVKAAMRDRDIDIDQEHVILFQNLVFSEKKDDEYHLQSWAYYRGGGNHRAGTAWVTDFELLDPLNLPRETPTVYDNGRPCTLGRYVVTYMGGVAHEFGHALGLPHNEQKPGQLEELGHTLMGSGNYHLFGERAGMEHGAFLSRAHATILASHPLFKRNSDDLHVQPELKYQEIDFTSGEDAYCVTGRVEGKPKPYAVIAYHDRMQHHTDYDALSWVAPIDEKGHFNLQVGNLVPGWFELRLRFCLVNGDNHCLTFRFHVDDRLQIPVEKLKRQSIYELHVSPAIANHDVNRLKEAIALFGSEDDIYSRRAKAYLRLFTRKAAPPADPLSIADDVSEVSLSSLQWESAVVGWADPTRDCTSNGAPLESGVGFHEQGIYAHAASRIIYRLHGKWGKLVSRIGLQNLCEGSVIFVVKCDGEERFRSGQMKDWIEAEIEVDLTGVDKLELIVETGDYGNWGDSAVWFSPRLYR